MRLRLPIVPRFSSHRVSALVPFQARLFSYINSDNMPPKFSPGSDEVALIKALGPLLKGSGGKWSLTESGEGIERRFKFKTFAKTWDFMTAVSLQCKIRNHHPEWANVYDTTFIRWTTHKPKGLSDLDVALANACDTIARDFGVVEGDHGASPDLKSSLDKAAADASGCCGRS